jgi:hypothetical protein
MSNVIELSARRAARAMPPQNVAENEPTARRRAQEPQPRPQRMRSFATSIVRHGGMPNVR